jgi:uncharacterized cupredoxin-like copper-binding protein
MKSLRSLAVVAAATGLALSACGGSDSPSDSDPTDSSDPTVVTEPADATVPPTDPAPDSVAETVAETVPETVAETVADTTADAAAGVASVQLVEWSVEAPTEYAAGDVTFTVTNGGSFPHEFVVIQGESYESLPLTEAGAVIEDQLPTGALLGRTARIATGASEDLTVTLAAGKYVLLCNLGGGGNSHAGQGQRLNITVS